jgi:ATP-dependent Clp protease ATP-binding subunit ClpB
MPAMRMDKLTSRFQQALSDAQSLAVGRDHNLLEPAHLLAALLDQQGGSTRPLLAQAGVNVPRCANASASSSTSCRR